MSIKGKLITSLEMAIVVHQMGIAENASFAQITRYVLIMYSCILDTKPSKRAVDRMRNCITEWREEYLPHDFNNGPVVISNRRHDEFYFIIDYFKKKQHDISDAALCRAILDVDSQLDSDTLDSNDSLHQTAKIVLGI